MDLKSREYFDWNECYHMTSEEIIQYMNRFFFIVEREVHPIAMKVWNQERRCNEIQLLDFNRFNLLMTNKRVKLNGKPTTLSTLWINSPLRMEYSQIIYWPGSTEDKVFNLCTGYQWKLDDCEKIYNRDPMIITGYLEYAKKFMPLETIIVFLSYLTCLVKRPEERLPDFIIVNNVLHFY